MRFLEDQESMGATLYHSYGLYGRVPEFKGSIDLLRRTCERNGGCLCLNSHLWPAGFKPDTHNFSHVCGETWQIRRQD